MLHEDTVKNNILLPICCSLLLYISRFFSLCFCPLLPLFVSAYKFIYLPLTPIPTETCVALPLYLFSLLTLCMMMVAVVVAPHSLPCIPASIQIPATSLSRGCRCRTFMALPSKLLPSLMISHVTSSWKSPLRHFSNTVVRKWLIWRKGWGN